MFKRPFSFDGRIRRLEYGFTIIICAVFQVFIEFAFRLANEPFFDGPPEAVYLAYIPLFWFLFAQGSKREHDLDFSGWWQLLPGRPLWLIFLKGQKKENKYGQNPKTISPDKNSNISNNTPQNIYVKQQNPLAEIENKERLLFNSMKNDLISAVEYSEKCKKLKDEKAAIVLDQKRMEIKNIATTNIKEKADQLRELVNAGLLTDDEYSQKYDQMLLIEIQKLSSEAKIVPDPQDL